MARRTNRVLVAPKVMVTTLPAAGSNTYPVAATIVLKLFPSVLPCTESVSVRTPQPVGSFRTSWSMLVLLPMSTWAHCGNALLALSQ